LNVGSVANANPAHTDKRPVVFDVGRILRQPVELAGCLLPAGVMVAPGEGLVQSDDRVYPDADRFDPDRMIGATLSPTTWVPFGGGARRCLGATFAMAEMRVVLREVLRRVDLATTTARGVGQRVKHVILTPKRGARIMVSRMKTPPQTVEGSTCTCTTRLGSNYTSSWPRSDCRRHNAAPQPVGSAFIDSNALESMCTT
jgi:hypothetical protein